MLHLFMPPTVSHEFCRCVSVLSQNLLLLKTIVQPYVCSVVEKSNQKGLFSITMCILEQSLNARTLIPLGSDVIDLETLNSNRFLLGSKNVCSLYLPCAEEYVEHPMSSRKTQAYARLIGD